MKNILTLLSVLFCLCTMQAVHAQDECATAVDITGSLTATCNTIPGPFAFAGNPNGLENACGEGSAPTDGIWFTFTAPFDGLLDVTNTLDPGTPDTQVQLETGGCGAQTCVFSDDDGGNGFTSAAMGTPIVSGTQYWIEWTDGWNGAPENMDVRFIEIPILSVSNITTTTADIGAATSSGSCMVEFGPTPFTPTGMGTDPTGGTITGLMPQTEYEVCYTTCDPFGDDQSGLCGYTGTDNPESIPAPSCVTFTTTSDAVCPEYNAISTGATCNGFQLCIGYIDTDQDGIGDNGENPTGTTMTVDFGAAGGGTFNTNGIAPMDTDGDGAADATGYCIDYVFDVQGCDPVASPNLVTLICPDGTEGVFNGTTLTAVDIIDTVFGIAGGQAFYPAVTANVTGAVCPAELDGSDAIAGFVEITAPDGTVCSTITGETPGCDVAGGNAAEPIQFNPIADPLLSSINGAGSFTCGIDITADLSYDCASCLVLCPAPLVVDACCNTITQGPLVDPALDGCVLGGATFAGAHLVSFPTGCDVNVIIHSGNDPAQTDTRLQLYDAGPSPAANCNNLVCIDSDDDGGPGFTSQLPPTLLTGGNDYVIEWDDRWSADGFDWDIVVVHEITTPASNPQDVCADGLPDVTDAITGLVVTTPTCITNLNNSVFWTLGTGGANPPLADLSNTGAELDAANFVNETCAPIIVNLEAWEGCAPFFQDAGTIAVTVYPAPMAAITTDDTATCGNLVADLVAVDGTVCETETVTCAADGPLSTAFATTATGMALAMAPAACAVPEATATCAGCAPATGCPTDAGSNFTGTIAEGDVFCFTDVAVSLTGVNDNAVTPDVQVVTLNHIWAEEMDIDILDNAGNIVFQVVNGDGQLPAGNGPIGPETLLVTLPAAGGPYSADVTDAAFCGDSGLDIAFYDAVCAPWVGDMDPANGTPIVVGSIPPDPGACPGPTNIALPSVDFAFMGDGVTDGGDGMNGMFDPAATTSTACGTAIPITYQMPGLIDPATCMPCTDVSETINVTVFALPVLDTDFTVPTVECGGDPIIDLGTCGVDALTILYDDGAGGMINSPTPPAALIPGLMTQTMTVNYTISGPGAPAGCEFTGSYDITCPASCAPMGMCPTAAGTTLMGVADGDAFCEGDAAVALTGATDGSYQTSFQLVAVNAIWGAEIEITITDGAGNQTIIPQGTLSQQGAPDPTQQLIATLCGADGPFTVTALDAAFCGDSSTDIEIYDETCGAFIADADPGNGTPVIIFSDPAAWADPADPAIGTGASCTIPVNIPLPVPGVPIFSGTGVTDGGDGAAGTFDPTGQGDVCGTAIAVDYSVTVNDAATCADCSQTVTANVTVYAPPVVDVDFTLPTMECGGEAIADLGNCTPDALVVLYDDGMGGAITNMAPPTLNPGDPDATVNFTVSNPNAPAGCEATGSYTITCPAGMCVADAPTMSIPGTDCGDGTTGAPFTVTDAGDGSTNAGEITEYLVIDDAAGTATGTPDGIISIGTLAAAQAAVDALADGDEICVTAITHVQAELDVIVSEIEGALAGLGLSLGLPATGNDLAAVYAAVQTLAGGAVVDLATIETLIANGAGGNVDLGAALGLPAGILTVDLSPFCYDFDAPVCVVGATCPVVSGTCPTDAGTIITGTILDGDVFCSTDAAVGLTGVNDNSLLSPDLQVVTLNHVWAEEMVVDILDGTGAIVQSFPAGSFPAGAAVPAQTLLTTLPGAGGPYSISALDGNFCGDSSFDIELYDAACDPWVADGDPTNGTPLATASAVPDPADPANPGGGGVSCTIPVVVSVTTGQYTFSGDGVTDGGDGATGTFDPAATTADACGTLTTITYEITNLIDPATCMACPEGTATLDVTVFAAPVVGVDFMVPSGFCGGDPITTVCPDLVVLYDDGAGGAVTNMAPPAASMAGDSDVTVNYEISNPNAPMGCVTIGSYTYACPVLSCAGFDSATQDVMDVCDGEPGNFSVLLTDPMGSILSPQIDDVVVTGSTNDLVVGPNVNPAGDATNGTCNISFNSDDTNAETVQFVTTPSNTTGATGTLDLIYNFQDFAGNGDFLVEFWDGTAYVPVFCNTDDDAGIGWTGVNPVSIDLADPFVELTDCALTLGGVTTGQGTGVSFLNVMDFHIRTTFTSTGGAAHGFSMDDIGVTVDGVQVYFEDFESCAISIANSTVSINWTDPTGGVTATSGLDWNDATGAFDFSHAFVHSGASFCAAEVQTVMYEVICDSDGSVISAGGLDVNVFPPIPTSAADLVTITIDPATGCMADIVFTAGCDATSVVVTEVTAPVDDTTGTASYTIDYVGAASPCCTSLSDTVTGPLDDDVNAGACNPATGAEDLFPLFAAAPAASATVQAAGVDGALEELCVDLSIVASAGGLNDENIAISIIDPVTGTEAFVFTGTTYGGASSTGAMSIVQCFTNDVTGAPLDGLFIGSNFTDLNLRILEADCAFGDALPTGSVLNSGTLSLFEACSFTEDVAYDCTIVPCTLTSGTCNACAACEESVMIDLTSGMVFNDSGDFGVDFTGGNFGANNPTYDPATNTGTWTIPAGLVNAFAAGGVNTLTLPDVVSDLCFTADIDVISGTTPFTVEFRIENGTGAPGNGGQALVFDAVVDGTGACSIGGGLADGTPVNGFTFTPGAPYSVVFALADFSNGPVPTDIIVDVSNIMLSICTPFTGPTISTTDPTTICVDGIGDPINVTVDVAGTAPDDIWVITDAATGLILGLPAGPPFDLDGAGPGVCNIYQVNSNDMNFMPAVGDDLAAIIAASTCANLSNPIVVTRNEVLPAVISTMDPTTICVDGVGDPINVTIDDPGAGMNGQWAITDAATGLVLALPAAPPFDLDGAGPGVCDIYWVNDTDAAFMLAVGDDLAATVSAACAELSNPITVIRNEVLPPVISTTDPTTICVDGVGDPINVTIDDVGVGATATWVITDDATGTVLALPPSPPFDLDGAGPGICSIYLLNATDANFAISVGDNIGVVASACAELSNPIVVVRNEVLPATISTMDPTTICVDGIGDPIDVSIDDAGSGMNGGWAITDAATGLVLALPAAPPFDLDGAGPGVCNIYWVNYSDANFALAAGDDLVATVAAACAALSNPIVVDRLEPPVVDAGMYGPICMQDGPITVTGSPADANGVWTGTQVTDNGDGTATFNPMMLAGQTITLTYSYTDPVSGCPTVVSTADVQVDDCPPGSCPMCAACEAPNELTIVNDFGFSGGPTETYDAATGVGTITYGVGIGSFGGHGFELDPTEVSALMNDDICIFADFVVTGDPVAFPLTLEWRIENTGVPGGFPSQWSAYDMVINGPGSFTLGGNVGSGTPSAAGFFDPNAAAPSLIVAVNTFNSSSVTDLVIEYSNFFATDGTCSPIISSPVISTTDPTTICVDGTPDPIDVTIDAPGIGGTSTWVITDDIGTILALPPAPPFDLDGAGPGICQIYLVDSDGSFMPTVGDNIGTQGSSTCAALSSPITVTRNEVLPASISTMDATTICVDGVPDPINVSIDDAGVGMNGQWAITDVATGLVLALPAAPPFDLDGAGIGVCAIYWVNSTDAAFMLAAGDDLAATVAAACAELSNPITVDRIDCAAMPCTLTSGACNACAVCDESVSVDLTAGGTVSDSGNFDVGFGNPTFGNFNPTYDPATNTGTWTIPAGSANAFAAGGVSGLTLPSIVNDLCFTADINVVSGDTPFVLEFRIENGFGAPGNGGSALEFNATVDGSGICSIGGSLADGSLNPGNQGTASVADFFSMPNPGDPTFTIVAALADFSDTPVATDIIVDISNISLSICTPAAPVTNDNALDVCASAASPIDITGFEPAMGGAWTDGAGAAVADATMVDANNGPFTYSFADMDGCPVTETVTYTVNPDPIVDAGTYGPICMQDGPITLTGTPTDAGGVWSGTQVTDNGDGTATFNPMMLAGQVITVTYDYTDANGCTGQSTADIQVDDCTVPTIDDETSIGDPCDCASPGNLDLNGDGFFDIIDDLVTITGPPGDIWTLTANGTPPVLDATGNPLPTNGTVTATEVSPGVYELVVYYLPDGSGFGLIEFTSTNLTGMNAVLQLTNTSGTGNMCDCIQCPTYVDSSCTVSEICETGDVMLTLTTECDAMPPGDGTVTFTIDTDGDGSIDVTTTDTYTSCDDITLTQTLSHSGVGCDAEVQTINWDLTCPINGTSIGGGSTDVTVYPTLSVTATNTTDCSAPTVQVTSADGTVCDTLTGAAAPAPSCTDLNTQAETAYEFSFFDGSICEQYFAGVLTSDCTGTCDCPTAASSSATTEDVCGDATPNLPITAALGIDLPANAVVTWSPDPTVTVVSDCVLRTVVYTPTISCLDDCSVSIAGPTHTLNVYPDPLDFAGAVGVDGACGTDPYIDLSGTTCLPIISGPVVIDATVDGCAANNMPTPDDGEFEFTLALPAIAGAPPCYVFPGDEDLIVIDVACTNECMIMTDFCNINVACIDVSDCDPVTGTYDVTATIVYSVSSADQIDVTLDGANTQSVSPATVGSLATASVTFSGLTSDAQQHIIAATLVDNTNGVCTSSANLTYDAPANCLDCPVPNAGTPAGP